MQLRARKQSPRRGATVVELAVLPLLAFLFIIGIDFARVFYHQVTVTSAARSGAIFGSRDEVRAADTAGIKGAALDEATNLKPAPDVKSVRELDEQGNPCLRVTVTWSFRSAASFPGVPTTVNVTKTVQMRIAPTVPKETFSDGAGGGTGGGSGTGL
jgi:Flp pilus assembly protein TadG